MNRITITLLLVFAALVVAVGCMPVVITPTYPTGGGSMGTICYGHGDGRADDECVWPAQRGTHP